MRVGTVHQGGQDSLKGVYHLNAVDEIAQFEIVCSVEKISERYLMPALETLMQQFPSVLLGFHADNGSEYTNRQVAKLLDKLLIEFTKSPARHSNDNALVESKLRALVRKHLGYAQIPPRFATQVQAFCRTFSTPTSTSTAPASFLWWSPTTKVNRENATPPRP